MILLIATTALLTGALFGYCLGAVETCKRKMEDAYQLGFSDGWRERENAFFIKRGAHAPCADSLCKN